MLSVSSVSRGPLAGLWRFGCPKPRISSIPESVVAEIGRLAQQQLREAETARAGPHLLGRQRREEVAGLLLIDNGHQRWRGDPAVRYQAHMDTLTARVEDSLLQQTQHIGIGAEHHLLATGEAFGFVLRAQRGERRRVNLSGDSPAQARQTQPDDESQDDQPEDKAADAQHLRDERLRRTALKQRITNFCRTCQLGGLIKGM